MKLSQESSLYETNIGAYNNCKFKNNVGFFRGETRRRLGTYKS